MEKNIVEIENMQYSYDRKNTVLTDFSLNIKRGGMLAVLGHNGAGKTTLLRLLGKLIQPHKGTIRWNVSSDEKIGYMHEGLGLYPKLSGYENIKLHLLSVHKKPDKALILSIINKIGRGDHAKKLTTYYSAGMKRRLSLACIAVSAPQLWLIDEPFIGIDPVRQKIMIDLLHEYKKEHATALITTHDLTLVKNLCGYCIIIRNGALAYVSDEHEDINKIETIYFQYLCLLYYSF